MSALFPVDLVHDAEALLAELKRLGFRLATVESCTGGLLAGLLTEVPGASVVVERGFVTYSNTSKSGLAGVDPALIDVHGAVSAEVARAMAEGGLAARARRRRHCRDGHRRARWRIAREAGGARLSGGRAQVWSAHAGARMPLWKHRRVAQSGWRASKPPSSWRGRRSQRQVVIRHLPDRAVCFGMRICPLTACLAFLAAWTPALAADVSVHDMTTSLYHADAAHPADFSHRNLRELDMSGLDFKSAKLAGSDLFGADLSGADLSKVDLSAARLDRVVIIGARFDGANLAGASLLRPSNFSTLAALPSEAASFANADLRGAKMFGRFTRANLRGANLEGATLAPFGRTGFIEHLWRTDLLGADLSQATLTGADLTYTLLAFSNLRGANLSGAILKRADLSGADLTGADLTGADLTEADLEGAVLKNVRGLDTAALARARNAGKVIR